MNGEIDRNGIIAEIEEVLNTENSSSISQVDNFNVGIFNDYTFSSNTLLYTQQYGLDPVYGPVVKDLTTIRKKQFVTSEQFDQQLMAFLQLAENFEEVEWFSTEEEDIDALNTRDKVLALKLISSPFDPFFDYLKLSNAVYAQVLGSMPLVSGFVRSKKKATRKDRRRERRDKEIKEAERLSGFGRYRKEPRREKPIEGALSPELKSERERVGVAVAKAIADNSLPSYLAVLNLLALHSKVAEASSLEQFLLPVGNLLGAMFDATSEDEKGAQRHNPFHFFTVSLAKRARSKSVTNSDISSRHDAPSVADDMRDEVLSQVGGPLAGNVSDAGSTIGSTFADLGTETASMIGDDMNEEEILAHAMALSMGEHMLPSARPSDLNPFKLQQRNLENIDAISNAQDDLQLDQSIDFAEIVQSTGASLQPFSSIAPFRLAEYWSLIYGLSSGKRVASNMVPINAVMVALIVAINVNLELKHTADMLSFQRNLSDLPLDNMPTYAVDIGLSANPENVVLIETLIESFKGALTQHQAIFSSAVGISTDKFKEWYFQMYLLVWSLQSLLRLSEFLLGSMRGNLESSLKAHSASNPAAIIAAVRSAQSRLRVHLSELAGLSYGLFKGANKFAMPSCLSQYLDTRLLELSGSLFGDDAMYSTLVMDYRVVPVNLGHVLRLAAIDAFLAGVQVFVTDPVNRFEAIRDAIRSADSQSEHVLLTTISHILLEGLQESITSGEDITIRECVNAVCSDEIYHNYCLQRLCVEVLKADEVLVGYYRSLVNAQERSPLVREFTIESRYSNGLQALMNDVLLRLEKCSLTSSFYGLSVEDRACRRMWGELDVVRCAQHFLFDAVDRETESSLSTKGIIYQDFRRDKAHPSLQFSDDLRVVTHVGPKIWATVLSTRGLEPRSGVYEWTVRVDRCTKGHVFLGIATGEFGTDKDVYVGVDKSSWGLIGTRSLWHNKGKVTSDFGTGFGNGSVVIITYDSDANTLSFRAEGMNWGKAFENLPTNQRIYPAFSLHEKGDQVSLLKCVRNDVVGGGGFMALSRRNSLDLSNDSWTGYFLEYFRNLILLSDKTVCNLNSAGAERVLLSPIVTILSSSLLAYLQSPRFVNMADSPKVVNLLPTLVVFSRHLATLADNLVVRSAPSSFDEESQSTPGTDPQLYGEWNMISSVASTGGNGNVTSHLSWMIEQPMAPFDIVDVELVNRNSTYFFGRSLKDKQTFSLCGLQHNSSIKVYELDESGSSKIIEGKVSLCGSYIHAVQVEPKSGKTSIIEGFLYRSFAKSDSPEKAIIKRLSLLAFSGTALLSKRLVDESFSRDFLKDQSLEQPQMMSSSSGEASSSDAALELEEPVQANKGKNWQDSILFSGGISLNVRNIDSIVNFLGTYLTKYNPALRDVVGRALSASTSVGPVEPHEEHMYSWVQNVMSIHAEFTNDSETGKMTVDGIDPETDEELFYSHLLNGKSPVAQLDEYLSMYVGHASILKLGGAAMTRARKMALISLIKHSGVLAICRAELKAVSSGMKQLTDRPVAVLLEVWRSAIRVAETIVRTKQESGESYEIICAIVCRKAEFLSQVEPSAACLALLNNFVMVDPALLINDRWYLEHATGAHNSISKLIAEITDFLTNSVKHTDAFYSKLVERSSAALLRIAGYRTFLYLLGKNEKSSVKFTSFMSGNLQGYQTVAIAHLPTYRLNCVSLRAEEHYTYGLKSVCSKIKTTLQIAFEELYEGVTQLLTKSTWSKDRAGQFAAVKAWNVVIMPEDHEYLSRQNLFRILNTVLDEIRTYLTGVSVDVPEEQARLMITYSDLRSDQRELLAQAKQNLVVARHRVFSQLILDTVHSLATQIASTNEDVTKSFDVNPVVLLRRTSSGPDTLSRSLFDLMFSEYWSTVRPLVVTDECKNEMVTEESEAKGAAKLSVNESEDYIFKILKLLKLVSKSDGCRKILTGAKWLSVLFASVGVGSSIVQRRLFRLLRLLLLEANVNKMVCCVPNLSDVRQISILEIEADDEEYKEIAENVSANSIGLTPVSSADGVICLLLECVSLAAPTATTNMKNSIETTIIAESISLLRILYGQSQWRTIIDNRYQLELNRISFADNALLLYCISAALGGYFYPKRLGGRIVLRPLCLNGSAENLTQFPSEGIVVNYSAGSSTLEVALLEQDIRIRSSRDKFGADVPEVLYTMKTNGNAQVRCIRLNQTDVHSLPDIPIVPSTISEKTVYLLLQQLGACLQCGESLYLGENAEENDLLNLTVTSVLRSVATIIQDTQNLERFVSQFDSLLTPLINIAIKDASSAGMTVLESFVERFAAFYEKSEQRKRLQRSLEPVPVPASAAVLPPAAAKESEAAPARRAGSDLTSASSPLRDLAAMLSPYSRASDPNAQSAALAQMLEMGLPREWCEFALRRCHYNVEMAINMCLEHGADMGALLAQEVVQQDSQRLRDMRGFRRVPAGAGATREGSAGAGDTNSRLEEERNIFGRREAPAADPQGLVRQLLDMGFPPAWCTRAVESSQSGNLDAALGWILSHDEELMAGRGVDETAVAEEYEEGEGDDDEEQDPSMEVVSTVAEPLSNPLSMVSGSCQIKDDLTCTTAGGGFPSVGCKNFVAMRGKWYHEVTVNTAGCVQVGWVSASYVGGADNGQGVGDDINSWSYDGWRSYLWHEASADWGARWKPNDVIGCALDMDTGTMSFYLNGFGEEIGMGSAFTNIFALHGTLGLYPCASFNRNESIRFNFGAKPFKFPVPEGYRPYQELITEYNASFPSLTTPIRLSTSDPSSIFDLDLSTMKHGQLHSFAISQADRAHMTTKRLGKKEESRAIATDALQYFSAGFDESGSESKLSTAKSLGKHLFIIFARLIFLRCFRGLRVDVDEAILSRVYQSFFVKDESDINVDVMSNFVHLVQVLASSSGRSKVYLQIQSVFATSSTSLQSMGSIFSVGGPAALFELKGSLRKILLATLSVNNHSFAYSIMRSSLHNLITAMSPDHEDSYDLDTFSVPTTVREEHKNEAEMMMTPSVAFAYFCTTTVAQCCFEILNGKQVKSFKTEDIVAMLEMLISGWGTALKSQTFAVKIVAVRVLSNIIQELILCQRSLLDHVQVNEQESLFNGLRKACLQLIEAEIANHPVVSDTAVAILELGGALRYIGDCCTSQKGYAENVETSHLSEESDDPYRQWEACSGRLLLDGDGWHIWTGKVDLKAVQPSIPRYSGRPRSGERQEFPPELLPGCKVSKKRGESPSAPSPAASSVGEEGTADSDFARWMRDPANSGSDSLSRLRMMFERSASSAERDRERERERRERERDGEKSDHESSHEEGEETSEEAAVKAPVERIGTVVSIETWPNSNLPGSARRIKWDDDESEEVVRWGADNTFDIVHCLAKSGKVTLRYPSPTLFWQRLAAVGFGTTARYGLIIRIRPVEKSKTKVGEAQKVTALIEWPEFNAIVLGQGWQESDGSITVTEEKLLRGADHAGWEPRFGKSSWCPGSVYKLHYTANGSMEGNMTTALTLYNRNFELTADVRIQNERLFHFDDKARASNVMVSIDHTSIAKQSGGGQSCVFGDIGFSSGVHFWELKIEQADLGSIFIGVSEKTAADTRGSRLNRWQGCGIVNNRSSYRTSPAPMAERVNVFGDHFQSGDVVGITLDLNRGKLYFFLDGLKYGEHELSDLGEAFDALNSPNGLKPRTWYPIVGLSKPMDRVTITSRWFSVPGMDPNEVLGLYNRSFQLLYSWNLERASQPLQQHLWIYYEGWRHFLSWRSGTFYRTRTRCSLGGISVMLNKSDRECVAASIRLGLSHPLLHGDRVVFTKSSGRNLDAKEEAIIVGCYKGRLWYKLDSQQVASGGDIIETGAHAWYLVPNDVEGMSIVRRAQHPHLPPDLLNIYLPRVPLFHGGFLVVFHEAGVVMRDGLEIDFSEVLCTVPVNSRVFAIEKRMNSSNINRYLIFYNDMFGWVSERMRGGAEEQMLRREEHVHLEEVEAMKTQIATKCNHIAYVKNRLYQREVNSVDEALVDWDAARATHGLQSPTAFADMEVMPFEEYLALSSTLDGSNAWTVEADMQLSELISKLSSQRNIHPLNLSMTDLARGLEGLRDTAHSALQKVDSSRLLARAAILREANLIFSYTLPYFNFEMPEEKEIQDVFGCDALIEIMETPLPLRSGETPPKSVDIYRVTGLDESDTTDLSSIAAKTSGNKPWAPSSAARRLRMLRRLLFTQTKLSFWESVLEATTTATQLNQDEYEDPKDIKNIKINRIKANISKLATLKSGADRLKHSVFGQLHREIRTWSAPAFRRSYIGKGHGGQRRAFKVKFIGEGVNDYGGPYRALFEQIVDELRFDGTTAGGTTVADKCLLPLVVPCPNRVSAVGSNQDKFMLAPSASPLALELTQFFGKLVGLCVRHRLNMPLDLSVMIWRPLVRLPVSLAHLETIDNFAARNLLQVIEKGQLLDELLHQERIAPDHQPEEWTDLNFSCFLPDGSKVPLLPGGEDMPVNVSNWRQYVRLTERLRLQESAAMYKAFREGLAAVLPVELFPLFTASELEQLVCGSSVVDIDLIRSCTEYEDLDPTSPFVQQFWEVLKEMTDEERTLFLRFVWARSRMPSSAKDFPMNFKLQRVQNLSSQEQADLYLPHAQTCFFSLAVPTYSSKELLRDKLLYAIQNSPNMDADVRLHTAEGWGDS